MKLSEIHGKINREEWILPPFQRDYVWAGSQEIISFMDSIYKSWPIGSIILWVPHPEEKLNFKSRELSVSANAEKEYKPEYILDGQQRLTTLFRVFSNQPFRIDNSDKFLYFDFNGKKFIFKEKMNTESNEMLIGDILNLAHKQIINKLNNPTEDIHDVIDQLKSMNNYEISVLRTPEIYLADALELFIALNTGGMTLPSVDLALGYISLLWDSSRNEFKSYKEELAKKDFKFNLDFLVRSLAIVSQKQALKRKNIREFKANIIEKDWIKTKDCINKTIDFLKSELNLDSNAFLDAENVLMPIIFIYSKYGDVSRTKLLAYWLLVSYLNQRFSKGQSTSIVNNDIDIISKSGDNDSTTAITNLVKSLEEDNHIIKKVKPRDIEGEQFKFILYYLIRTRGTRDIGSDKRIGKAISNINRPEFHHIFADAILKKTKFKDMKEDIANKTFLTSKSNKKISDADPTYLSEYKKSVLKKHFIPTNKNVWNLKRYEDFLYERKKILSREINLSLRELIKE